MWRAKSMRLARRCTHRFVTPIRRATSSAVKRQSVGDLEERMILARRILEDDLELIEFEEAFSVRCARPASRCRHRRHHSLPQTEPEHPFERGEFAVDVAGAEPSLTRSVLCRSTDAVVMSIAFDPLRRHQSRK
jgi:hypothetical protein